eukprot:3937396-Rhodomonas_salina.2
MRRLEGERRIQVDWGSGGRGRRKEADGGKGRRDEQFQDTEKRGGSAGGDSRKEGMRVGPDTQIKADSRCNSRVWYTRSATRRNTSYEKQPRPSYPRSQLGPSSNNVVPNRVPIRLPLATWLTPDLARLSLAYPAQGEIKYEAPSCPVPCVPGKRLNGLDLARWLSSAVRAPCHPTRPEPGYVKHGQNFRYKSTAKSRPRIVILVHFALELCGFETATEWHGAVQAEEARTPAESNAIRIKMVLRMRALAFDFAGCAFGFGTFGWPWFGSLTK